MLKRLKRFAIVAIVTAGAVSASASGPFGTPVGTSESGSIVVPALVGGLPLGVTLVSIE
jgi:hypothetical protein